MPDPYTYVGKPTGTPYSTVNPQGKETYDQATITFDDPNVFYDGVNEAAYTNVSKPTSSVYTIVAKPI